MKDKAINDAMDSIENRLRHVYNQGYEDGVDSVQIDGSMAYKKGLEDAWECARKILFDGSLSRDILTELGADTFCGVIQNCSASEAIAKLKEYEEQQITISEEQREKNLQRIFDTKKQTEENLCADCETCRFADLTAYEFPCSVCSASHTFRWEARKGAEE